MTANIKIALALPAMLALALIGLGSEAKANTWEYIDQLALRLQGSAEELHDEAHDHFQETPPFKAFDDKVDAMEKLAGEIHDLAIGTRNTRQLSNALRTLDLIQRDAERILVQMGQWNQLDEVSYGHLVEAMENVHLTVRDMRRSVRQLEHNQFHGIAPTQQQQQQQPQPQPQPEQLQPEPQPQPEEIPVGQPQFQQTQFPQQQAGFQQPQQPPFPQQQAGLQQPQQPPFQQPQQAGLQQPQQPGFQQPQPQPQEFPVGQPQFQQTQFPQQQPGFQQPQPGFQQPQQPPFQQPQPEFQQPPFNLPQVAQQPVGYPVIRTYRICPNTGIRILVGYQR